MISIPSDDADARLALRVCETLRGAGHEAYLVGGCVRDLVMGRKPMDYDVATSALPNHVQQEFPRCMDVGKSFGVIIVRDGEAEVEVATYRADGDYTDGRRPSSVRFTDAREDALRRDFTINALFADPVTGMIRDEVNGLADIKSRQIRAVGVPRQRFEEDSLRVLRAVRLASDLNFEIEMETLEAIREHSPQIHRVSPERIQDELTKGLTRRDPGRFLELLNEVGLLIEVLPEMVPTIGCEQPPEYHPEGDVFVHTCLVLSYLPENPSPALAWAALLHDVGKPPCRTVDPHGRIRFNDHARVGAQMIHAIADRLRWSNELRNAVIPMVARHMDWINFQQMRTSSLRRWLAAPTVEDEFWLHRADCFGSYVGRSEGFRGLANYEFGRQAQEAFRSEQAGRDGLPTPLVTGKDLIALGLRPGPDFKGILEETMNAQLEGIFSDRSGALQYLSEKVSHSPKPD